MAITVKHKFVSAIPDSTDATIVRPSNWNDDHQLTGTVPVANGGTGASTLTGYVSGNGTSAMTASTTIPNSDITGLGTMSTQNANNVTITGGSLNSVAIGQSVAGDGSFDVLTANVTNLTNVTSSAGIVITGTFSGSAPTDGLVMDYATGWGRFSDFGGDGFQWFNNGLATNKLMELSASGVLTTTADASIHGLTVGLGGGGVSSNTAVGSGTLNTNSTGSSLVAIGLNSLYFNTTGVHNAGLGQSSLQSNTTGGYNTALGNLALYSNTTASNNTAVGYQAGYSSTVGNLVAVGYQAGYSNTTGLITAVGYQALKANTTGNPNEAFGYNALTANTTGSVNNAFGYNALTTNTTGSYNVALGGQALQSNTTASYNTAVGFQAGYSNTTGEITSFGYYAGGSNTTGLYNTAIGYTSLNTNNTGGYNTAVGRNAMYSNSTGSYNTVLGMQALNNNTTASNNTAVGYKASYLNTTGTPNEAFGYTALYSNTTGGGNQAIGFQALTNNSTGNSNVAVGTSALYLNSTASNNTAVGYQAGYSNTTGAYGTFVGYQAGYTGTTNRNTCVGNQAGYNSTGIQNNFFGDNAGSAITTGTYNSILGSYNGNQNGLDIRTASNYIVLSDGAGNPRAYWNGATMYQNGDINATGNVTAYYSSDAKFKQNIRQIDNAIEKAIVIGGKYFDWTDEYIANKGGADGYFVRKNDIGVVAQDVQTVLPEAVRTKEDGTLAVDYQKLVSLAFAAIAELKAEIDVLRANK